MDDEQLKKCIDLALMEALNGPLKDAINQAVQTAVKTTVNGKIDGLRTDVKPILDLLDKGRHVRTNIGIWVGAVLAIGGAISALQSIGDLASHYVNITFHR